VDLLRLDLHFMIEVLCRPCYLLFEGKYYWRERLLVRLVRFPTNPLLFIR